MDHFSECICGSCFYRDRYRELLELREKRSPDHSRFERKRLEEAIRRKETELHEGSFEGAD